MSVEVKVKRLHPDAVIPSLAHLTDCGADITAVDLTYNDESDQMTYHTGLAVEIPVGYVGLLFARSSIKNYDLQLSNSVGVIDSGYRGEIKVVFNILRDGENIYKVGDRVCQLIILPYPNVYYTITEELSNSDRGIKGFGSTNMPVTYLGGCI